MSDPLSTPTYRFWGSQKPKVLAAATQKTTGSIATIRIYGPIDSWGGWWGTSAKEVAEVLDGLDDSIDTIQVRLNSPGGDAFEGVAIMNLLRAHKARTVVVVDGLAASAASIIATGCEELVMSPGSELMIHDASTFAYGDATEMEKARRMLDSVSNTIASVYAAKAGGTTAEWREVMKSEAWYTADEAVAAKLADSTATVPDAGPTETAGGEPEVLVVEGDDVENAFDLSRFHYAGRSQAPAPAARAALKPPAASADGSITTEGGSAVAFTDEQMTNMRRKLGIAEDADEATILAALDEALDETEVVPVTAELPEGTVVVEAAVLTDLRSAANEGREARRQQNEEARDRAIKDAIAAGKTTPARKDHWVTSWNADPDGTKAVLDSLEPGLVPVAELGHADDASSEDPLAGADPAKLNSFLAGFGLTKEALNG